MASLRDTIYLRSYAQTNPLQDYVNEGYSMFNEMLDIIAIEVVLNLVNAQLRLNVNAQANPEENKDSKPVETEPKIESKNKEDESLIDTTNAPTTTAKEQ